MTGDLPTEPDPVAWTRSGILLTALQGVENHLFRLDPEQGRLERLSRAPYLLDQASVSDDGNVVAFAAATSDRLAEIYRARTADFDPVRLTDMTAQVDGWSIGTRELVDWIGPGGVRIEGILHKPTEFDPSRRYPLLVVVHGGPRAVSTPALQIDAGAYPSAHFLRKGALVIEPNYRGSIGCGGAFRQLHRRGLGVENRLVIYPGRGHGIGSLRQRLGALWHNWQWFLRHLWDEAVELPVDEAGPDLVGGSHVTQ